jgi:drug/metabolite transporter (DMT)-like permease
MLGNTVALACAVAWSLSVILLKISGARIHPIALNMGKNIFGLILLVLTCFVMEGGVQWPSNWQDTLILLASGLLGIGIADCLVLTSMRYLNASQIAILECLFSPFVIVLSVVCLGDRPTPLMLLGGTFIMGSLYFLKPSKQSADVPQTESAQQSARDLRRGSLLMAGGLFLVALGIVMITPLFDRVPLFSLVAIRMIAGAVGSTLIFATLKGKRRMIREFFQTEHQLQLYAACFMSAYLSIILWIAGYKYLEATVAALLNQTSTFFTTLFAVIFLKESMTREKYLAVALAVVGVVMITFA